MCLPENFLFSQSNLQDYVECARRFELRYLEQLRWPAVEVEPIADRERHMRHGADFHHMIHQHLLGVPADRLSPGVEEADLQRWWAVYLNDSLVSTLPDKRYPEVALSTWVSGHRLMAKYDLVAVQPGERVMIVDWKTSRSIPARVRLLQRMQTIIYRYVMASAGAQLNAGQVITPDQIEMVYWFVENPAAPERFPYDELQYEEDAHRIATLIAEVVGRSQYDLTTDIKRCRFCPYRSLCERGIEAGHEDDMDMMDIDEDLGLDFDLDFDQVAEIEF